MNPITCRASHIISWTKRCGPVGHKPLGWTGQRLENEWQNESGSDSLLVSPVMAPSNCQMAIILLALGALLHGAEAAGVLDDSSNARSVHDHTHEKSNFHMKPESRPLQRYYRFPNRQNWLVCSLESTDESKVFTLTLCEKDTFPVRNLTCPDERPLQVNHQGRPRIMLCH